ncbi:MAG: hypothetical protein ABIP38_00010 [Steroidobacteraceae bacterium]
MPAFEIAFWMRRPYLSVALACLVWALLDNLGHLSVILRGGAWGAQVNSVLAMQCKGFGVFFAMRWIERRGGDRPAWWPYPCAVIAGAFGGSTFYWLLSQRLLSIATHYRGNAAYEPFASFVLRHGLHGVAICGLVAILYLALRDSLTRQGSLRTMQTQRAEAERQLAGAQLIAARSRVEPIELQRRLAELETLYEKSPALGETALLELSRMLRAAVYPEQG